MTVNEMQKIFVIENIIVNIYNNEILEEQHENGENYYMIKLNEGSWIFILSKRGVEDIKLTFDTKEQAIRFFCIFEIKRKFISEYINYAVRNNDILYSDDLDKENLIELFNKYSIKSKYYNLNNTPLTESICLKKLNNDEYVVELINKKMDCIFKSEVLDKHSALFMCFRWTYLYYLLLTHVNELQSQGLFLEQLHDNEIILILSSN